VLYKANTQLSSPR